MQAKAGLLVGGSGFVWDLQVLLVLFAQLRGTQSSYERHSSLPKRQWVLQGA